MLDQVRLNFDSLGWYAITHDHIYGTIFDAEKKIPIATGVRWKYIAQLHQELAQVQSNGRSNNGRKEGH
jgi:hypothetical protein